MLRLNQVKLRPGHSEAELKKKTANLLHVPVEDIIKIKIIRQSIDARKKPDIFFSYVLEADVRNEDRVLKRFRGKENQVCRAEGVSYRFPAKAGRQQRHPVVIAGMGPAGLFCGYFLALHGYRVLLLERGKCVEERRKDVERFWETGRLDTASNVQFGEGGAGTFSDGKLNTLVKDKDGRNAAVLETFVKFGAKESICYEAKPHIGTDVLCGVVKRMREEIIRLGGRVYFESQVTEVCIEQGRVTGVVIGEKERIACEQLVLAIGHSARDTFSMLYKKRIPMEAKAFAVGLRVEHPQAMINESQYACTRSEDLGAASYKLTAKARNGRGVYSFCMCPGGYVVNASSEEGYTAVNGMSYSGRDGCNANSAVVVTVTPADYGSSHPLAGIDFQRQLEQKAYALGEGRIPVQRYGDFKRCVEGSFQPPFKEAEGMEYETESCRIEEKVRKEGKAGIDEEVRKEEKAEIEIEKEVRKKEKAGIEIDKEERKEEKAGIEREARIAGTDRREASEMMVMPQCKGRYQWADVSRILPRECNEAIVDGMEAFGRQIAGFDRGDACLSGVESRTSSPVRILRDESMQSEIQGLFPCGEGAGYAGGILSAAMDGLRVAEAIAVLLK